jgi:hypothetical protein
MPPDVTEPDAASVMLHWIPLGAGGHCVRLNGKVFEAFAALRQHRRARDLYHSAIEVRTGNDSYVIEMTPAWGNTTGDRGVVREGPVGTRWLGRSVYFRYEVRRWRAGVIPDIAEAVISQQVSHDLPRAQRLLRLVPEVPSLTWGRDELHTGDMWNSNSLNAWLLARSNHDTSQTVPPARGRAPGWHAGLILATRQQKETNATIAIGCDDQPVSCPWLFRRREPTKVRSGS